MNILVPYLATPPCCHSVYSLTSKFPSKVQLSIFHTFPCLHPRLPAASNQNRASRWEVSASLHSMQGYLFSSASWRNVGGAIAGGGYKVAFMKLLQR